MADGAKDPIRSPQIPRDPACCFYYIKSNLNISRPRLIDLQPGENCLWTWEEDNVTDGSFVEGATPGQHGFYRMNGGQVRALTKESNGKFFGPQYDRFGSDKGK